MNGLCVVEADIMIAEYEVVPMTFDLSRDLPRCHSVTAVTCRS